MVYIPPLFTHLNCRYSLVKIVHRFETWHDLNYATMIDEAPGTSDRHRRQPLAKPAHQLKLRWNDCLTFRVDETIPITNLISRQSFSKTRKHLLLAYGSHWFETRSETPFTVCRYVARLAIQNDTGKPFRKFVGPIKLRLDLQFSGSINIPPTVVNKHRRKSFRKPRHQIKLRFDYEGSGLIDKSPTVINSHSRKPLPESMGHIKLWFDNQFTFAIDVTLLSVTRNSYASQPIGEFPDRIEAEINNEFSILVHESRSIGAGIILFKHRKEPRLVHQIAQGGLNREAHYAQEN